jgi:hypothetical protein
MRIIHPVDFRCTRLERKGVVHPALHEYFERRPSPPQADTLGVLS